MLIECVPIHDWGVSFGYGLFETLRIYNGIPFLLEAHLDRMLDSSRQLGFFHFPTKETLTRLVDDYVKNNRLVGEAIRLSVTYGSQAKKITPRVFITHRPVPYGAADYEQGIATVVSPYRKNEFSPVVNHKTFNQLENILSFPPGGRDIFGECIFLNTCGYIAEGSKSNLFFVRDKEILTPSVDCGLLPGVTRRKIIDLLARRGIRVREGRCTLEELCESEECFCSNSLMEVLPIVRIGENPIGNGRPGELTRKIMLSYRKCIEKERQALGES
ncbi:MAG: aminotransferase class IV family protein [Candidatus Aminicenantes bacterium]|nr:aminotransferase class IV family protein [Candidatus Aminicenantes bacterium]